MDRRCSAPFLLCTAAKICLSGKRNKIKQMQNGRSAGEVVGGQLGHAGWRLIIGECGPPCSRAGLLCPEPAPADMDVASIGVVFICGSQHSSASVHDSRNRLRLMKPGRGSRPVCRGRGRQTRC